MEVFYFFFLTLMVSLSTYALPVLEDPRQIEQANSYFPSIPRAVYNPNLRLFLTKRQIEHDIGSDESSESDESDDISPRNTRYHYYPYFRIRRFHYSRPEYPLSNYANSRDKFPTVA